MYTISSQPIYDSFSQSYKNIYTIDRQPTGILSTIVRRMSPSKLSPFKVNTNDDCNQSCIYAINQPNNPQQLLCMSQLGLLFSFLISNNYLIDTKLTSMMNKSKVEFQTNFICFITQKQ
jgi:hypothetical protein